MGYILVKSAGEWTNQASSEIFPLLPGRTQKWLPDNWGTIPPHGCRATATMVFSTKAACGHAALNTLKEERREVGNNILPPQPCPHCRHIFCPRKELVIPRLGCPLKGRSIGQIRPREWRNLWLSIKPSHFFSWKFKKAPFLSFIYLEILAAAYWLMILWGFMKHWGKLGCLWLKFPCPWKPDLQEGVGFLDNEGEELSEHRHPAIINILLLSLALFKARVDGALTRSSERYPCPWQKDRNEMVLRVPFNQNHPVIPRNGVLNRPEGAFPCDRENNSTYIVTKAPNPPFADINTCSFYPCI